MDKSKRVRITPSNPIDDEAFKAFLKFLSPEIKLLAETYKFASEIFAELGLLYYWEKIFNLPAAIPAGEFSRGRDGKAFRKEMRKTGQHSGRHENHRSDCCKLLA